MKSLHGFSLIMAALGVDSGLGDLIPQKKEKRPRIGDKVYFDGVSGYYIVEYMPHKVHIKHGTTGERVKVESHRIKLDRRV